MKKPTISLDLRRRVIAAYEKGLTPTYEAAAKMFGIGVATVNRLLRRKRETGDVLAKARGGNNPRVVDDDWVRAHCEAYPDATLRERVAAWAEHCGKEVSIPAMSNAVHRIGWTHKKRRRSPANATRPRSSGSAKSLRRGSRSSSRAV